MADLTGSQALVESAEPEADATLPLEGSETAEAGPYDPASFWDTRLRARFDLAGVGFRGLGTAFNEALYRQRAIVLGRAVRRFRIPLRGADIVELGPGSGFYVERWRQAGAGSVLGLDIAAVSAEQLAVRYPDYSFRQADITEPWPTADESADLVTAFDVLFHVVDDARFARAIGEAARVLRRGGILLVSDLFLHGEPFRGYHQASRTLDHYRAALDAAGIEILGRLPIFVTMHPALDLPPGRLRSIATRWWDRVEATLLTNQRLGRRLGLVLGLLDRVITLPLRGGPSTELLVARRR